MYQNGEILKVAFLQRQPFSLTEEDKMAARQKSVSAQLNSVITQMAFGQASPFDMKDVMQKGWDTANKSIDDIENGHQTTKVIWIQIGDPSLKSQLLEIESDKNFVSWSNPELIQQIKNMPSSE